MSRRGPGRGGSDRHGADPARARLVVGRQPVRELLRSEQPVTEVLLAGGREASPVLDEIERLAAARGVRLRRLDVSGGSDAPGGSDGPGGSDAGGELERIAGGLVHQGVAALAPTLPTVTPDALVDRAQAAGEPPLLVALDHVTDPHNLGSIARSAEAVGAHGLVLPERRAAGVTAAAEKAAAGAFAHLPLATVANLNRALAALGERGVWSLGLDGDADTELADHPLVTEPCVLVVGAEGGGLSRLTRERCDALVRLAMRGRVGSLNASVAAGVALYELLRHRR